MDENEERGEETFQRQVQPDGRECIGLAGLLQLGFLRPLIMGMEGSVPIEEREKEG